LAKIFLQKGRYAEALAALDTAGRLDSKSASVHYLRGRVLQAWGHGEDAQSEFAISASMQKSARDELEREVSGERLPNPEIAAEPRR
jgi:Tfp pilus assembly protein PilF